MTQKFFLIFWAKQMPRQNFKIAREANLTLAAREAHGEPQKQWRFLKIAEEKTAKVSESLIWARIYNLARTFFQNLV
jgi:hypothetical protein